MGWRFRKSKKIGIFRTTVSKKGVGTSIGITGLRFGVSPGGKKYFSFGIPKTGLYYIKYFKNKNKKVKTSTSQNIQQPTQIQQNNGIDIKSISSKF
jgi:hypothetical protein